MELLITIHGTGHGEPMAPLPGDAAFVEIQMIGFQFVIRIQRCQINQPTFLNTFPDGRFQHGFAGLGFALGQIPSTVSKNP